MTPKEKFDIAFNDTYEKMEQQEPTGTLKFLRKMLKNPDDYDADVIEYSKYLMKKLDIELD